LWFLPFYENKLYSARTKYGLGIEMWFLNDCYQILPMVAAIALQSQKWLSNILGDKSVYKK